MAELGDRAKDQISGCEGIVTTTAEHLYGCRRLWLQPTALHEGKPVDGFWVDDPQVVVLEVAALVPEAEQVAAAPSGPRGACEEVSHR